MAPRLTASLFMLLFSGGLFQACRSGTPPPAEPSEGIGEPGVPTTPAPAVPENPGAPDAAPAPEASDPAKSACSKDEDCVPAACCHPSSCVSRSRAPDCKAALCTMECRSGTLDCGGSCLCQNGQCAAKLNDLGGAN
ncbi:MAG TPA: hypothetical protein VK524_04240 [Polyangiaceae bacterium]|nr:hypothetical protein [Polyangiaceae bacterium]